jgi:hypothetical protein
MNLAQDITRVVGEEVKKIVGEIEQLGGLTLPPAARDLHYRASTMFKLWAVEEFAAFQDAMGLGAFSLLKDEDETKSADNPAG